MPVSRRQFITGGLVTAAGAAAASCNISDSPSARSASGEPPLRDAVVPFDGVHQAGIATPAQAHLRLLGFNIQPQRQSREDMIRLMRVWTDDARRMTAGQPGLSELEPEMLESVANLTVTVGYGRGFFDKLGLEAPEWLGPLPAYETDNLQPEFGEADIMLQVCGDDHNVVSHVSRYLIKGSRYYTDIAWVQDGHIHARGSHEPGTTPRNHFGQLDGSGNPGPEEYDDLMWINEGPDWLVGGTSMVVRRIRLLMDEWDIVDRHSREVTIGREITSGAPLSGGDEFTRPDLEATDEYGLPAIDPSSHVARAITGDPYERIVRRAYNYDVVPEDLSLRSDMGQIFISFQQDPLKQFHPIQARLAEQDRLNEWIEQIGSSVFVIPRGTSEDEMWGQSLLE